MSLFSFLYPFRLGVNTEGHYCHKKAKDMPLIGSMGTERMVLFERGEPYFIIGGS